MRRALAAAALALATAASARPLPCALVWLPAPDFRDWSRLDADLLARPALKLTVALTPDLAASAGGSLPRWVAAGRAEAAARAAGDAPLALTAGDAAAPRPDDALEAAAGARAALEKALGAAPSGFVPGGGALTPSLIGPLSASGASWVLAGPYAAADSSWTAEGGAVFVPARSAGQPASPDKLLCQGALVVDDSAGESGFLTALERLPADAAPESGWSTVSGLIRAGPAAQADASAVASWPGWDGAPAAAPKDPGALAAWKAYEEAARAVTRYQNSGSADLRVLERAGALLRSAAQARFFLAAPPGASPESELRERLLAVYRELKQPAPDALFSLASSTTSAGTELPSGVSVSSGAAWIAFDNPAASTAAAPSGTADARPWILRTLRVEWNDERVLFKLSPSRVALSTETPQPVYDLYVDVNHVAGAGATSLLDGRNAFISARDGWEYALSLAGGDARLWRAGGDGPEELSILAVETDVSSGTLSVSVPRSILSGNPTRWGYVALSLAEPGDGTVLGALAPLRVQKALLEDRRGPRRLPAARAQSN